MRLFLSTIAVMFVLAPVMAAAADLGPGVRPHGYTVCQPGVPSPILAQPNMVGILAEVHQRYVHAVDVAQRKSVVFSPSQVYTWAEASKLSCGKAIGFLNSSEVNPSQITECDCYHSRMLSLMN